MKFYKNIFILLFASAFAMVSCSEEEDLLGDDAITKLELNVSDSGFQAEDIHSRAIDQAYKTTFTDGDAIGVFAVKGGNIVDNIDNRKFFMEDGIWELDGDVIEYKGSEFKKMKFYAYYPYDENLTIDPTAEDPFHKIVKSWKVEADQSGENYTKYDLMTSVGEAEGQRLQGKIEFTMQHRMALAVIAMPKLVYEFTNADLDDYEMSVAVGDFSINSQEAKPYFDAATGTYMVLVKPDLDFTIKGTYTGAKEMEYEAKGKLESGGAKQYTITDKNKLAYTLAIGDFFCADGRIVSGESETIPENCIGIVCYVGNPQPHVTHSASYPQEMDALYRDYPKSNHGLVLSLNNAVYDGIELSQFHYNKDGNAAAYGDWFKTDEEWVGMFDNCNTANQATVPETRYPGFVGYNNTVLLTMCYEGKGPQLPAENPYFFINAYRDAVAVPATTSPWYIPSVTCLNQVAGKLSAINNSLGKIVDAEQMTSTPDAGGTGHYWTSTQRNSTYQWAHGMGDGNYICLGERGSRAGYFRMMLAF